MGEPTLSDFKDILLELKQELKRHMEVEEIQMRNHINTMNELRNDVKELKESHNHHINQVQEHIENKISVCNSKITHTLENQYMTKPAIEAYAGRVVAEQQKERHEAINGLRKRLEAEMEEKIINLESKARLVAWTAGTIMGVVTTVIGLWIKAS